MDVWYFSRVNVNILLITKDNSRNMTLIKSIFASKVFLLFSCKDKVPIPYIPDDKPILQEFREEETMRAIHREGWYNNKKEIFSIWCSCSKIIWYKIKVCRFSPHFDTYHISQWQLFPLIIDFRQTVGKILRSWAHFWLDWGSVWFGLVWGWGELTPFFLCHFF